MITISFPIFSQSNQFQFSWTWRKIYCPVCRTAILQIFLVLSSRFTCSANPAVTFGKHWENTYQKGCTTRVFFDIAFSSVLLKKRLSRDFPKKTHVKHMSEVTICQAERFDNKTRKTHENTRKMKGKNLMYCTPSMDNRFII